MFVFIQVNINVISYARDEQQGNFIKRMHNAVACTSAKQSYLNEFWSVIISKMVQQPRSWQSN